MLVHVREVAGSAICNSCGTQTRHCLISMKDTEPKYFIDCLYYKYVPLMTRYFTLTVSMVIIHFWPFAPLTSVGCVYVGYNNHLLFHAIFTHSTQLPVGNKQVVYILFHWVVMFQSASSAARAYFELRIPVKVTLAMPEDPLASI